MDDQWLILVTMSFPVRQKIKGNIYLYEATSTWDPVKKQSKQTRKYLGREDPQTGKPITPRKLPVVSSASDFGNGYLLTEIVSSIGIKAPLLKAFDPDKVNALLSLVCFQILESKPWYLYDSWSESVHCKGLAKLTSQRISELLRELGKDEDSMLTFFREWALTQQPIKGVFLDITSLSSYGQNNNWLERGYNRDGESLPQVNLGVLLGGVLQLPLFYQLYPGSIVDVSTLHNTVLRAKDLGFNIETWIMDKGFYSASNIAHLETNAQKFITTMPLKLKEALRIIGSPQDVLNSPVNSFCLGKEVLFIDDTVCTINKKTELRACLYLNQKRRAQEIENFVRRLETLEYAIKEQRFKEEKEAKEWINRQWKGCLKFYTVTLGIDGVTILERKHNTLSDRMNRMGKMILVTNQRELTPQELLEQYRNKDRVEKVYDALKNGLNEDRLRTHSTESMIGKMFVTFLSLIVQTALINRMNTSKVSKNFCLPELLMELKKIRCFERTNGLPPFLSEISKKQREIFTKLNIPIPDSPSLLTYPGI